jgi:hypothetical protein
MPHDDGSDRCSQEMIVMATAYEIRFDGEAGPALMLAFEEGLGVSVGLEPGATVLRCRFRDQAELQSVINAINSLALRLLDVRLVPGDVTKDL